MFKTVRKNKFRENSKKRKLFQQRKNGIDNFVI